MPITMVDVHRANRLLLTREIKKCSHLSLSFRICTFCKKERYRDTRAVVTVKVVSLVKRSNAHSSFKETISV